MATIGKITSLAILASGLVSPCAQALPTAEDIPEEILRTEIILEGRSPIDGQALSAAEYEELKVDLAQIVQKSTQTSGSLSFYYRFGS